MKIDRGDGTPEIKVWVDDLDGLLGLVSIDVIELHPWGATVDDLDHPDLLAFNLKPGDGTDASFVVETARRLRELLAAEEQDCWPKTTGDGSLHVMVPIEPTMTWDGAREFTKTVAERLAATAPGRYTLSARTNRTGKLLIDYLRNGRDGAVVGPYSPRALPGFPVAMPLSWDQLDSGTQFEPFTMQSLMSAARP